MSILERFTTLFAPDDCLNCGRESSLLCNNCWNSLPPLLDRCFGCHKKVSGVGCIDCIATSRLTHISVAANYTGVSKALVARLKFSGNQSAARIMAAHMSLPDHGIIVSMPATTAHVRQRGFDQSHLIARHLSRRARLPYCDVLRRSGQQHQLGSNREQRLHQLQSTLTMANAHLIRNKDVFIIDDVLTTGSSITAATNMLKQAGAKSVSAIIFAQSIK